MRIGPAILSSFAVLHTSSCLAINVLRMILTHFLFNLHYLGFFSRFLILLCHKCVLFPACHVGWKHTPALFPVQKKKTMKHFTFLWISIYDSLSARNKMETECAWLKGTQPTFGKFSDNISCKCLLYNSFSSLSLLATVWLS